MGNVLVSIFKKGGISSARILLFIVVIAIIVAVFNESVTEGKITILAGMFAALLTKAYLTDKNVE